MAADAFLDQVQDRAEVVRWQAHGQMRDEAFEHQLQIGGEHVDIDVVAEVASVALAQQALPGGHGELLGAFGPARTELRIGAQPPEGIYVIAGRILTFMYFAYFLILLPLLSSIEKPRPVPNSIADAVLARSGKVASIAVLPFLNRSASSDDEYFSDGLADELLNLLAKIKGLRVSARASSFHFKGKDVPLAEVGKALNVATVLDGTVRKAGNRARIAVQLVKVSDGYHQFECRLYLLADNCLSETTPL